MRNRSKIKNKNIAAIFFALQALSLFGVLQKCQLLAIPTKGLRIPIISLSDITPVIAIILFLCALETITAPGSAIPGQPTSESNPIEIPFEQQSR